MNFSFIHAADIHLGRPFSDLSTFSIDEQTSNLYKTATMNSFKNIISLAIEKSVDFILIAGDTFDSKEHDFQSKLILKEGLKQLEQAGIKVFLICGNHDPVSSYNKNTFNFDENSNIKIIGLNTNFYGNFPVTDKNNNEIAIINALSFQEEKFNENPIKFFSAIKEENKTKFNIGLLHCDLNANNDSNYAPCNLSDLKSLNYNYWALGHIHKPDIIAETIIYSGTIQSRNTKETGNHGIRYIKVENNNIIENSFIPTDIIRYENININISDQNDSVSALNYIEEEILSFLNQKDNTCKLYLIKLNLSGNIKFYKDINQDFFNIISERIKEESSYKIYITQIINSTKFLIDENSISEDTGISGEIYKIILDNSILEKAFKDINIELNSIISKCNFNDNEFNTFKEEIINKTKKECLNLCSNILDNESNEE